jgi:hypothetical protein
MPKYDPDGTSAKNRAERSATDKLLNGGDRAEFRKFCDETAKETTPRDDK